MIGIDNLKKIIVFSAKNESLLGKVAEGGFTKEDLAYLPEFVIALPDLIAIHWSEVPTEAKDLTIAEAQELVATHNEIFNLPESEQKIEIAVEAALTLITQVTATVMQLIAIFKKPVA